MGQQGSRKTDNSNTFARKVKKIAEAMRMTVSSLKTYNSWEMAAAARPVPRIAVPVLVMRLGEEGSLLMISVARSSGGEG
jgi:hypothetical protein